jgi:similar to stage IV sporulation protein
MYAEGFVRIKIWGSGVERFLVVCSHQKILLWDIEAQGKYIFLNMKLKDFMNCRKIAKKTGIRAVVVKRYGLPFFMPKIIRRSGMVVGLFVFLAVWFMNTNMLLHINLEGNHSISEDVFKDFLEEQNVTIGMWKKDISLELLEKEIRKKFDLVTWTSAKLDGTVLTIYMKENDKIILQEESRKWKLFLRESYFLPKCCCISLPANSNSSRNSRADMRRTPVRKELSCTRESELATRTA